MFNAIGGFSPMVLGGFLGGLFGWLISLVSIFLILLILVQRGRGGGLTGALGGPGGQSAFGSKAGDMFTRITFGTAGVWILLCALAMWSLGNARNVVAKPDAPTIGATGNEPELPAEATESTSGLQLPSGLGDLPGMGAGLNAPETGSGPAMGGEAAAEVTSDEEMTADETPAETPAETPTETPAEGAGADDSGN